MDGTWTDIDKLYFDRFRCDADPAALAKYVLALLKKNKPEEALRDLCVDQLEVFLSSGKERY